MFLNKIKSKQSGVLLYGITPPKVGTSEERIAEIAEKTLARLYDLNIDALIVYDVQDESSRTQEERPFPFINALDPYEFANAYLSSLNVPKIIYRPAGKFNKEELTSWLQNLTDNQFFPVFVGLPSPDYVPLTTLKEAYELWNVHQENSAIGAVMIPERHAVLKDEEIRILDKMSSGVSYFVTQCVFNVDYAKAVLKDLKAICSQKNIEIPTMIFTLTACGSAKTLKFMEWLGIHIPDTLKEEFLASENILAKSVDVCLSIAQELIDFCSENSVPVGFNIESVAIRKEEIEASIFIVNEVEKMLIQKGLR
jgi:hypothetical protein